MRVLLATVVALACAYSGATTRHGASTPSISACDAASLKSLLAPELFESFFNCVDPMRRLQYPEGDQDTTLSVDISRAVMEHFLSTLDHSALNRTNVAEMEFHFNIAPKAYTDTPVCKDMVSVRFFPERCRFRMVVSNNFLVPPNWCQGAQVVHSFTIGKDRVLDFYRDESG